MTAETPIILEHSPLGGSGADRWFNCAGSFLLHRDLMENGEFEAVSSGFADIGTAAHELGARCLIEGKEPYEYAGQTFAGYKAGDEVSLDAVAAYINICNKIRGEDGKGTVLIEKTIHLPDLHPLLQGTVDFGYWSARRGLWLRDYKNGEGVGVDARDNRQLLYYAFLMVQSEPWLRDSAYDSVSCNLGIVQPNYRSLWEPEDVWSVPIKYVRTWGNEELLPRMKMLSAQRDIFEDDFIPGGHCQFCPVMLECPKAQQAFQTYVDGTEFPEMLTNEEIDALYAQKDLARKFMNELDKVAYARAIGGTEFQHGKLVAKKGNREWRPEAEKALAAALGDAAYEKKLRSPAQVEKLSPRGKAMAQEWGYKPVADGLSFVTMSDDRPAAKPKGNGDVFKNFEQKPEDAGW